MTTFQRRAIDMEVGDHFYDGEYWSFCKAMDTNDVQVRLENAFRVTTWGAEALVWCSHQKPAYSEPF